MRTNPTVALLALLAAASSGCTSEPIAPLPPPLPETEGWGAAEASAPRAFLGLKTRENLGGGFDALDFPPGVRVTRVVENSPAAAAGLRAEDVVLSLDGAPTNDPGTLDALVDAAGEGARATLEVQRGDSLFAVEVTLGGARSGGAPSAERLARLDPARSRAAWASVPGGVELRRSHPDAPFPRAGVPVGSVVHAVDGEAVRSDLALVRALQRHEPGARVEVDVMRPDGERVRRRVRLAEPPRRITRFSIPILVSYRSNPEGTERSFTLLDLWLVELFGYERLERERHWRLLGLLHFSTGVGELGE